jgi:hypothetical protein
LPSSLLINVAICGLRQSHSAHDRECGDDSSKPDELARGKSNLFLLLHLSLISPGEIGLTKN